jgi:glycosyltransferase involved in cell wall biosynthesis
MAFKKLSVIVPVYNEELYVEAVIRRVMEIVLPAGLTLEIIVVDDGSTDRTREVLESLPAKDVLKVHFQNANFGKGTAIRAGLEKVTGDIVLIQDADLEYSVSDYPTLLQPILDGKATVVYGSRFLGKITGMKFANRVFNILIRLMVNALFGARITDEATAYKLMTTDIMRGLHLQSQRFEICPEMTAKILRQGHPIYEVPIEYNGRNHEEGKKIGWRDAVSAITTLLRYRFAPL